MYVSTKRYGHERGYTVAYRQHLADSHCKYLHGYSLAFEFEFQAETLDVRNWVCDFGGFSTVRDFLDKYFDHTLLVAQDDPELEQIKVLSHWGLAQIREVEKTGCEGIAEFLFEWMNEIWMEENGYKPRVFCSKVEVFETPSNSAYVTWNRNEWNQEQEFKRIHADASA